jgi:hypothetical protein
MSWTHIRNSAAVAFPFPEKNSLRNECRGGSDARHAGRPSNEPHNHEQLRGEASFPLHFFHPDERADPTWLASKLDAVDRLWEIAVAHALVRALGNDRVQAIISEAFAGVDFHPFYAEAAA